MQWYEIEKMENEEEGPSNSSLNLMYNDDGSIQASNEMLGKYYSDRNCIDWSLYKLYSIIYTV